MQLANDLSNLLAGDRVSMRYLDRIAHANDASVYRLVPRVVVHPIDVREVQSLLRYSRTQRIPLTFRAAGTSLSGQSITDGILAVLSRHWRQLEILDGGQRVRVQPGVIGGFVNRQLEPLGAKIGPDPASINSCMMGGILANNSSGMCCGVAQNAYHTLDSMRYVLPSGLVVDSALPDADETLRRHAPQLATGLQQLKHRIESDAALRDRIRVKYRLKNTMGYSLNAFLDYARPVDILTHLMIGSEGTLGFIAEAVLRTVRDYPFKHTGLLFFPDVPRACSAIAALSDSGARALELMDRASLRAIESRPGIPNGIRDLAADAAGLLVEYQCESQAELEQRREDCERLLPELPLCLEPTFTRDAGRQAELWQVRRGLIPSVGAMRRRGTSFIIEDVVFPPDRLATGVTELQAQLARHGYDDAIVFGHAKDGNLHFVLTQAFDDPGDVARYDRFMHELAELVAVRHGGALKAEHGTGRNMAPFVMTEWGPEAYEIMREVKRLVDPDGLLNPGVILNDDPNAHVTHLKDLPAVETEVDGCIECGFCEPVCPSRDLTLTPRQRIVVRREMARLRKADPESLRLRELSADYVYAAIDSCAADGLCALSCPVGIDTGKLVKQLRCEAHGAVAHEVACGLARRFEMVEGAARTGLAIARGARRLLGERVLTGSSSALRRILGDGFPVWHPAMPAAAPALPVSNASNEVCALYFPACVSRVFGPADPDELPLPQQIIEVASRSGNPLRIPDRVVGHCCGLAFGSKGYDRASRVAVNRLITALWKWSDGGALPVVVDSSPCAYTLKECGPDLTTANRKRFESLTVLDAIEFAADRVVPGLKLRPLTGSVALHPVCSVRRMNLTGQFQRLAESCAEAAVIPISAGCCGFAGDRGFTLPALAAAATQAEAAEVTSRDYVGHYSSSRTCEIGLTRATGRHYHSYWSLLDRASSL